MVWRHGQALLADVENAVYIDGDLRDPEGVLSDDEDVLDDSVGSASFSDVLASVLPSPERAGSMLAEQRDEEASAQGPSLSTHARPTSGQQDPVLTVYAHNAAASTARCVRIPITNLVRLPPIVGVRIVTPASWITSTAGARAVSGFGRVRRRLCTHWRARIALHRHGCRT